MKNTLTKAGLTLLTFSLVACGGNDNVEPSEPDFNNPPPYSLFGETFVDRTNKPEEAYIHNNAKGENPIQDLNAVYFNDGGERIPLPVKGIFHINDKKPHIVGNTAYSIFIANDRRDMSDSRYAYLSDMTNHRNIFSFSGELTKDMPKTGIASYKGDAIHTFVNHGHRYTYRADAKASIDFGKPNNDAMLTVTVSPKEDQHFKAFNFGARVENNLFNGKNDLGSLSEDKAQPRATVISQGQFNGLGASELVGHYKITKNADYPNGAEGVFGLKKEK